MLAGLRKGECMRTAKIEPDLRLGSQVSFSINPLINLFHSSFRNCHRFLAQPLHHRKTMKAYQDPLPPGN